MGYRKVGYLEQVWYVIKWKICHRRKRRAEVMPERPKPLSGRDLDIYARDMDGLTRKPGETDEQLRRRCMAVEVERCYGGAELTINEGDRENE